MTYSYVAHVICFRCYSYILCVYIYSLQQITKHRGWSMSLWAALPVVLRYVIAPLLLSPCCWLMLAGKELHHTWPVPAHEWPLAWRKRNTFSHLCAGTGPLVCCYEPRFGSSCTPNVRCYEPRLVLLFELQANRVLL